MDIGANSQRIAEWAASQQIVACPSLYIWLSILELEIFIRHRTTKFANLIHYHVLVYNIIFIASVHMMVLLGWLKSIYVAAVGL